MLRRGTYPGPSISLITGQGTTSSVVYVDICKVKSSPPLPSIFRRTDTSLRFRSFHFQPSRVSPKVPTPLKRTEDLRDRPENQGRRCDVNKPSFPTGTNVDSSKNRMKVGRFRPLRPSEESRTRERQGRVGPTVTKTLSLKEF